jgi:hypothetical protein
MAFDLKPLFAIGGVGLLAVLLFGSRSSKAATPPLRRYEPTSEPHVHGADERLGPNFLVGEWLHPPVQAYKLTETEFQNLSRLVTKILQPFRTKIDPSTIEITGGGRPVDFRTDHPITVTNWKTKAEVTVPAGSTIEDVIRAQGYAPVANSDHHRFACADFVIRTGGKLDSPLMEKGFVELQSYPDVRQVGIYRVDGQVTHLHVAVVHPGHPKIEGTAFAYQSAEGE